MVLLFAVAIFLGVVAALICYLIGKVIVSAGAAAPPLAAVGSFLVQFCWVIGLLVGIAYVLGLIGPFKL